MRSVLGRLLLLCLATVLATTAVVHPTGAKPDPHTDNSIVMEAISEMAVSLTPVVSAHNASSAQIDRIKEAVGRFAAAGLELPDLAIEFIHDGEACGGHLGRFSSAGRSWTISICSSLDFVYEHEFAHAWERATMTDDLRRAFMGLRGYRSWSSPDIPWNQRGIEGVAAVIQQGLSGVPLPPVIGAEFASRLEAFELLTGRPAPRLVEWITAREIACSDRPTKLSLEVVDRSGTVCASEPPAGEGGRGSTPFPIPRKLSHRRPRPCNTDRFVRRTQVSGDNPCFP